MYALLLHAQEIRVSRYSSFSSHNVEHKVHWFEHTTSYSAIPIPIDGDTYAVSQIWGIWVETNTLPPLIFHSFLKL